MSKSDKLNNDSISKLIADKKKHQLASIPDNLIDRLLNGDPAALSESITLIESDRDEQRAAGQEIVIQCLPRSGNSIRIGITGVPGVGKSTFIESFGSFLVEQGKRVAVLAIDPSSEQSGGSILGDKTRMQELSSNPNAFIRPSASSGSLGGVSRKTRESIFLCEAAGFEVILIETVGVGQSEIAVHSMTDFFMLLMLAGAGDELQGIKRGIMEMADGILVNKADGDNIQSANLAKAELKSAIHLFPPKDSNWIPQVETISALDKNGNEDIWAMIESFINSSRQSGYFQKNRENQQEHWLRETVQQMVLNHFYGKSIVQDQLDKLLDDVNSGKLTSYQAAEQLFDIYKDGK